jgi:hypothetical protein
MVYTDGIHLTADSLDELFEYANKIGLNLDTISYQGKTFHPHFKICGVIKQKVLTDTNVEKVSCKEIVRLCILNFRVTEKDSTLQKKEYDSKNTPDLYVPSSNDYERMIGNIFKKAGFKRS